MTERKRPEERRRQIADAALAIIGERGLARLTAAAIARELNVTDAALFHHFRDMDAILLAAIERVEELLFGAAPPAQPDPIERLGAFFRQRVATMHRNPGAGRLVLSDVLAQIAPPLAVARVKRLRSRSVAFIRSCLRASLTKGTLADGVGIAEATVVVLGSLMALTQARELVAGGGSIDGLAAQVWHNLEQFLRGHARSTNTRSIA